jgi:hypothetical protein
MSHTLPGFRANQSLLFLLNAACLAEKQKASRRLAENDIITRGITVKIQQVAVHGNYENPSNDAKVEDE